MVRSGRREVALGLLPAGTGNDFGKTLGVSFGDPEAAVRVLAGGAARSIDVGRAGQRHFLNVLGFGFDLAVIADAARTPLLRGDALYRFCALKQLFRFPGLPLELSDGAGRTVRGRHLMLVIANARYFGGSFLIAPRAELADGRLDAVAIRDAGPLRRAKLFGLVAKGTHEGAPEVATWQSSRFHVVFTGPVPYEVDGEVFRTERGVVEVESLPAALRVIVPPEGEPLRREPPGREPRP
jgi:diacylglycerol kinase (ATP)